MISSLIIVLLLFFRFLGIGNFVVNVNDFISFEFLMISVFIGIPIGICIKKFNYSVNVHKDETYRERWWEKLLISFFYICIVIAGIFFGGGICITIAYLIFKFLVFTSPIIAGVNILICMYLLRKQLKNKSGNSTYKKSVKTDNETLEAEELSLLQGHYKK
jgi:hypothetical protein